MDKDEQLKLIKELNLQVLAPVSIESINFRPHPYVITPSHLAKSDSPYLNEHSIRYAEQRGAHCGHTNKQRRQDCRLPYSQHTCDTVLFVRPARDILAEYKQTLETPSDVANDLRAMKELVELHHMPIDGFAFLEPSKEK